MSGTITGGLTAAQTNKERHGDDFYKRIGALGGRKSNPDRPKGFAANRELARTAGMLGGKRSKRTK